MIIDVPISLGELLDKISILHIKHKNINDDEKKKLVEIELELLEKKLDLSDLDKKLIDKYIVRLTEINSKLWKIEDSLRDYERNKTFDKEFIELARSVYFTNDERSKVKLEINTTFGSKIVEVKSYEKY